MRVLALIVIVTAFVVWVYPKFTWTTAPCEDPITYTVGSFDRRFGISQNNFLKAIVSAEVIWEKPFGKELFSYIPENGELAVNLIYDHRQEVTDTLSDLGDVLDENEITYKSLQNKYVGLKAKYENAKNIYNDAVAVFNQENTTYQAQVDAWNNSPRTSKKQFNELENQRKY